MGLALLLILNEPFGVVWSFSLLTTNKQLLAVWQSLESSQASNGAEFHKEMEQVAIVDYMCSSLLQMAPGSHDLIQAEKRITVCKFAQL